MGWEMTIYCVTVQNVNFMETKCSAYKHQTAQTTTLVLVQRDYI